VKAWLVAVALNLAVVAAGCASSEPADQATSESGPTTTSPPRSSIGTGAAFTLDDHLAWLIAVLATGAFDSAEATERFDPAFLAEVPVAALNAPLTQIAGAASAPWQVVDDQRDGSVAEVLVESATGTRLLLTFAIAADPPHRIEGLALQPAPAATPDGYTPAQLDAATNPASSPSPGTSADTTAAATR